VCLLGGTCRVILIEKENPWTAGSDYDKLDFSDLGLRTASEKIKTIAIILERV